MSTSDPPNGTAPPPETTDPAAVALTGEIARLANELFARLPGLASAVPGGGATAEAPTFPGLAPTSPLPPGPPHLGPSALSSGASGAAVGLTVPPAPGIFHQPQPPWASAPPPRETDLRTLPATLSDTTGVPLALGLVAPEPATSTAPYFLPATPPTAVPGAAREPPLTEAPLPRDSGLRGPPDNATFALPLGLLGSETPATTTPYFLNLVGSPPAPGFSASQASDPAPAQGAAPLKSDTFPLERSLVGPLLASTTAPYFLDLAGSPPAPVAIADAAAPAASEVSTAGDAPAVVPDLRPSPGLFDAASIRRDFPILEERVHGRRLVWLDNAATTQKPRVVIDRLSYFYEHENSNVHRAAHALAARATDAYEAARDKVRRFLNAPSAKNIVFVRGTTEAINLVAQSWGRRNVGAGDEIVISWLEHHANIVPWQQLAVEKGARLRVAPVDDRGQVILEEFEKLLGPRTRLVSVSQVSNALGTIVPVDQIVEMGHRYGARVLIDGAQAVSHMPVDVQALDCDFYCFSGHKIFAPTGIGALYGKTEVLEAMPPWQGGGNMISDVTFEKTTYQPPPGRFEAGTGNIADAVGLGAALDYVSALGLENISRYEHELLVYATKELERVPGLRLIGTAPEKAGVLSFILDGVRTEDVGGLLDQEGIAVRSGHHCAQPILRRFGLESTVRASLAPYNTCEDVDALVAALLRIQAGRPSKDL